MGVIIHPYLKLEPMKVHVQIDPHSGVPVYRQVMDQVRHVAASGLLGPGDKLPSIRELSRGLAVNPTTVVKAYTELEHLGVIVMRQVKGAFLTDKEPNMTPEQRRQQLRRLARQMVVEAGQMGASEREIMDAMRDELKEIRS